MEKISDIQKQITETEKQIGANKEAIKAVEERIRSAQQLCAKHESDTATLREQRQTTLAKGEDVSQASSKIKELQHEIELKGDEITGLNTHLDRLRSETYHLSSKLMGLEFRVPQLRSLHLASEYNKVAAQLAGIVKELNETNWMIERDLGGKVPDGEALVVFALKEGALTRIPKIYFDDDGPTLGKYVARHPGIYPSGLSIADRCFYDEEVHRNDMRNGRS